MLTGGYWDGFLVAPFAVRRDPPRRVAMLGFAGGTAARAYARYFPADAHRRRRDRPRAVRHRPPLLRRCAAPAAARVRRGRAPVPAPHRTPATTSIFLDAYRQPYIPFYLSTREFFALARDRLAPGGVVVVNVGHPRTDDQLEKVLSATMGDAFDHVARDPVEPTNTLLIASQRPITRDNLLRRGTRPPRRAAPARPAVRGRLAPPLRGGAVYTDDKAPVEWLIDKSIVEYAAGDN